MPILRVITKPSRCTCAAGYAVEPESWGVTSGGFHDGPGWSQPPDRSREAGCGHEHDRERDDHGEQGQRDASDDGHVLRARGERGVEEGGQHDAAGSRAHEEGEGDRDVPKVVRWPARKASRGSKAE